MKALILNGALERRSNSTSEQISLFIKGEFERLSVDANIWNIAESGLPTFDVTLTKTSLAVEAANHQFRQADVHVWLTPLYHGGMTGAMKNCLDWLEFSAKLPEPYLTGRLVGLVCWGDGGQAMQGINAMDAVAKALRAWTAPLSVPIQRGVLFDAMGNINPYYQDKLRLLLNLLVTGPLVGGNRVMH